MEVAFGLFLLYTGFVGSFIAGYVAAARGRSAIGWFLIAAIATPLLALLALNALPDERRELSKL